MEETASNSENSEAGSRAPLHRVLAPSSLVPEEAILNYVNDDIEDIYKRMDNVVKADKVEAYVASKRMRGIGEGSPPCRARPWRCVSHTLGEFWGDSDARPARAPDERLSPRQLRHAHAPHGTPFPRALSRRARAAPAATRPGSRPS